MASVSENMAYLAGLLDGEGCVTYKQYWDRKRKDRPHKYFCWRIQMEIVMTHKPTIQWCGDTFGGKVYEKPRKTHKMQYRWRRSFRDALEIAKAIIPYSVQRRRSYNKLQITMAIKHKIKKKGPVPGTQRKVYDYKWLPKQTHDYVDR